MKLTLMLMGGSAFLLIGILGIYYGAGATSMNLLEIAQMHNIPIEQQRIWFPLTFLGFGVLGALFPFHTWSPDGHASAPTAVSMLHAGVLMKLGGYGCFPHSHVPDARSCTRTGMDIPDSYRNLRGIRCILRLCTNRLEVYQCLLFRQPLRPGVVRHPDDEPDSLHGAVLQMLSHGLMTALFFALIGMIYGRTHTRDVRELSGLMKIMPFSGCLLRNRRSCQSGITRTQRFHCRNDHLHRFVPASRYVPPRVDGHCMQLHRDYGSLYPATGRKDSLWHLH